MRVVLDCNVLIPALVFDKSLASKIFGWLQAQNHPIYTSPKILGELESRLRRDFPILDDLVPGYMRTIVGLSKIVEPVLEFKVVRDSDDNKILECAVTAQAQFILTYDKDLLVLKMFQGIEIMHPADFKRKYLK